MCMGPPASIRILRTCCRVYPHVYGATTSIQSSMGMGQGLSPCVWGHRIENDAWTGNKGSIPMCMGLPVGVWLAHQLCGVYPHVYGASGLRLRRSLGTSCVSASLCGHLF